MRYLCDSCKHSKGTVFKTYTDSQGVERREEYVSCPKRWTRPKVPTHDWCFDYEGRKK